MFVVGPQVGSEGTMTASRYNATDIAASEAMQPVLQALEAAIAGSGGVLICGEAGTGREVIARAIHRGTVCGVNGSLEDLIREAMHPLEIEAPFVTVNCAAGTAVEEMLFGTTRTNNEGRDYISSDCRLRQAFGGTLFLGSVHEMRGRVQARFGRVLRDGEVGVHVTRGTPIVEDVHLRMMASIDAAAADAWSDERVAPELQRRLAGHRIVLPPLRARRDDIPGLVRVLLCDISKSLKVQVKSMSTQALELLCALPWHGNLAELSGLLLALVMKVPDRLIRLNDVLANIRLDGSAMSFHGGGTLKEARERFEREYVAAVLEMHRGRMPEAARALGIQRTNLYRKIRQLAVERKNGRSRS
jgi:DNA-binding NtrC family response regulator